MEEELMTEVWHLLKNEEEGGLFHPTPFSFDYKTVAQFLGCGTLPLAHL